MLALWDRLHEMGVEFPFPQRDITIKSCSRRTRLRPPEARRADEGRAFVFRAGWPIFRRGRRLTGGRGGLRRVLC